MLDNKRSRLESCYLTMIGVWLVECLAVALVAIALPLLRPDYWLIVLILAFFIIPSAELAYSASKPRVTDFENWRVEK